MLANARVNILRPKHGYFLPDADNATDRYDNKYRTTTLQKVTQIKLENQKAA